ncbi:uncharacterized protein BDR25DRAFT_360078 [Lindgomyces ingoldianus]|uniref:Uncharacterized protein n=1 Tax=Lindgomyces ingoldianus TaxID=673940 RepID=A0ACB6QFV9_9PLEO|nr:uncharacterized protein BDR25DRAFT_360078 [Lindgomyces ingoldianus]KAF2465914.1 hypothetical protein BDR25DRAFT_360078 [Lindgomyces ingoldianus]
MLPSKQQQLTRGAGSGCGDAYPAQLGCRDIIGSNGSTDNRNHVLAYMEPYSRTHDTRALIPNSLNYFGSTTGYPINSGPGPHTSLLSLLMPLKSYNILRVLLREVVFSSGELRVHVVAHSELERNNKFITDARPCNGQQGTGGDTAPIAELDPLSWLVVDILCSVGNGLGEAMSCRLKSESPRAYSMVRSSGTVRAERLNKLLAERKVRFFEAALREPWARLRPWSVIKAGNASHRPYINDLASSSYRKTSLWRFLKLGGSTAYAVDVNTNKGKQSIHLRYPNLVRKISPEITTTKGDIFLITSNVLRPSIEIASVRIIFIFRLKLYVLPPGLFLSIYTATLENTIIATYKKRNYVLLSHPRLAQILDDLKTGDGPEVI